MIAIILSFSVKQLIVYKLFSCCYFTTYTCIYLSLFMQNAGILEPCELTKVSHEKEKSAFDATTMAEIDRTVKKYADNLLHTLEGVSSRLTQLESRTHHLESSVDELKVMIGNSSSTTDGKLRQLENILREVCLLEHHT